MHRGRVDISSDLELLVELTTRMVFVVSECLLPVLWQELRHAIGSRAGFCQVAADSVVAIWYPVQTSLLKQHQAATMGNGNGCNATEVENARLLDPLQIERCIQQLLLHRHHSLELLRPPQPWHLMFTGTLVSQIRYAALGQAHFDTRKVDEVVTSHLCTLVSKHSVVLFPQHRFVLRFCQHMQNMNRTLGKK